MNRKTLLILVFVAAALVLVYFFVIKPKATSVTNLNQGTQTLPTGTSGGAGQYATVPVAVSQAAQATPLSSVSGLDKIILMALQNTNKSASGFHGHF
jgi:anionic cell wall polymer biosynthesis LytR-Cps2A-Psr (LCP) family protein